MHVGVLLTMELTPLRQYVDRGGDVREAIC